ncbi:hypothetical protein ACFQ58_00005 [Agromyces sp. NPDC056523]|uniref:hypothetical protein n=1 Tax=Agromyces sp. NPDC056523 TaxID=3345850 RepID=UPI0036733DFD
MSFPERPFDFFFPESGPDGDALGETYFEEGLAESLLARYWRCSWLDANLNAAARGDSKAAGAAAEQLNRFGALPGAEGIDLSAYSKAITREAEQVGQSPSQYEYDLECGFYESEGANR